MRYYRKDYRDNGDIVYFFDGKVMHFFKNQIDMMLKDGVNLDYEFEKLMEKINGNGNNTQK